MTVVSVTAHSADTTVVSIIADTADTTVARYNSFVTPCARSD